MKIFEKNYEVNSAYDNLATAFYNDNIYENYMMNSEMLVRSILNYEEDISKVVYRIEEHPTALCELEKCSDIDNVYTIISDLSVLLIGMLNYPSHRTTIYNDVCVILKNMPSDFEVMDILIEICAQVLSRIQAPVTVSVDNENGGIVPVMPSYEYIKNILKERDFENLYIRLHFYQINSYLTDYHTIASEMCNVLNDDIGRDDDFSKRKYIVFRANNMLRAICYMKSLKDFNNNFILDNWIDNKQPIVNFIESLHDVSQELCTFYVEGSDIADADDDDVTGMLAHNADKILIKSIEYTGACHLDLCNANSISIGFRINQRIIPSKGFMQPQVCVSINPTIVTIYATLPIETGEVVRLIYSLDIEHYTQKDMFNLATDIFREVLDEYLNCLINDVYTNGNLDEEVDLITSNYNTIDEEDNNKEEKSSTVTEVFATLAKLYSADNSKFIAMLKASEYYTKLSKTYPESVLNELTKYIKTHDIKDISDINSALFDIQLRLNDSTITLL